MSESWKRTGAIVGALVGMFTLHGLLILPMIMDDVHAAIHQEIQEHSDRPHKGSVGVDRWDSMERRLERIEDLLRKD